MSLNTSVGVRDWPLDSIAYEINCVSPDSSVGLATRYGLEGRRSNPGGGQIFLSSITALGPTQPPVQWAPGFYHENKAAGPWRCPPILVQRRG